MASSIYKETGQIVLNGKTYEATMTGFPTVDANPETEATDTLEKITVGKTTYDVEGGSPGPTPTDHSVTSVERLGDYLFKVTFATIPEFVEMEHEVVGGCSAFVREGKLYRNLDFNYDNTAVFWTKCKGFEGMAFIKNLNDGEMLDYNKIKQLPYHLSDGRNDHGIRVSTHLLFNDWQYTGAGSKDFPIWKLPYVILSELTSIDSAQAVATALNNYLANVKPHDPQYLLQFLITDGTHTYAIVPPTAATGSYQVVATTSGVARLTNFRYVGSATLTRNAAALQNRPTGVERWNLIDSGATLEALRFTRAYTTPNRLSEFIGINETTKSSTDAELKEIYDLAHDAYLNRERDGETWQTVYSVVYSAYRVDELYAQENYEKNYAIGGVSTYADLPDKPRINGVDLVDNQTTESLHITHEMTPNWTTVDEVYVPDLDAADMNVIWACYDSGTLVSLRDSDRVASVVSGVFSNGTLSIACLVEQNTVLYTYPKSPSENYVDIQVIKPNTGGLVITPDDMIVAGGYDVPDLTINQVTALYNALVAGKSCTVTDKTGDVQFRVSMGDATTGYPSILLEYYWLAKIDYQITKYDTVTITAHDYYQPRHEITSVTVGTDTIDLTIS